MTRTVQLVIAAALALYSVAAVAQGTKPGEFGYYAGMGGGATKMKGYCNDVNAVAGFVGTCDETTTGFKAFGGYKLNRHFGLELGYSNFGQARADGSVGATAVAGTWRGYGIDLSAVGFLPLGDRFELFAKGGVAFWDVTATTVASPSRNINDSGLSGVAGAGAILWLFPQVGLRVQYERFQGVGGDSVQVKSNVDFFSINVVGRF